MRPPSIWPRRIPPGGSKIDVTDVAGTCSDGGLSDPPSESVGTRPIERSRSEVWIIPMSNRWELFFFLSLSLLFVDAHHEPLNTAPHQPPQQQRPACPPLQGRLLPARVAGLALSRFASPGQLRVHSRLWGSPRTTDKAGVFPSCTRWSGGGSFTCSSVFTGAP